MEHLIAFTLNPERRETSKHITPGFPEELRQRIQALPGVRSASLAGAALMQRIGPKTSVARPGQKIAADAFLNTTEDGVSSSFFETLGIPIVSGRNFSDTPPTGHAPTPTVINQAFANLIFPNENPLGKAFGTGATGDVAMSTNLVVGIAGDSKYRSLREPMLPIFYAPILPQSGRGWQFHLYVRTQGPPAAVIASARKVLFDLDPQLPFSKVYTMQELVSESLWQERLLAVLAGVFSVISVLMAGTGLYGAIAYDVSQRTYEFGIRNAIGAQKRDVAILLLRELAAIVVPGAILGVGVCLSLMRVIASALYGIKPLDPLSFAGALLTLSVIGLMAIWQPLRRAMNTEPAVVLRQE